MKPFVTWMMALAMMSLALPGFAEGGKAAPGVKAAASVATPASVAASTPVVDWIVGFMTRHAPPGRETYYVEAQETKEDAEKRYRSIAEDLVEVVYNPANKPLFGGSKGRSRTISILLGIMLYESGFGRNVDFGVGKFARGDNGRSWCLMQMNVGKGRTWKDAGGWNIKHDRPWRYGDKAEDIVLGSTGPEMVEDRRKCFTEGLRLIRISFRSCRNYPLKERLRVYASGSCKSGAKGSRIRMTAAIKFFDQTRAERKKFVDADVIEHIGVQLAKREEAAAEALAKKKAEEAEDKRVAKKEPESDKPSP